MKKMNDRKMDMSRGKPMSDSYFPEDAHQTNMMKTGDISTPKYPDTESEIHQDQEQAVKASDKARLPAGYRH